MRWDQISLRVMLYSLGVTALTGVAAIFTAGHEVLLRLLGTGAITTAAAGLMRPLTKMTEMPTLRPAGLFGMGAVLVEFFLLLAMIWIGLFFPNGLPFENQNMDLLFLAAGFIPMTAFPAFLFLQFLRVPVGWLSARVGAVSSAVVFVELMIGTWFRNDRFFRTPEEDWSVAAAASAWFGLTSAACLAGTLTQRPWRWVGVIASLVCWVMMTGHALHKTDWQPGESVFTVAATLAVLTAYANLVSLPSLAPNLEIVRTATLVLAVLTAAAIDAMILQSIKSVGGDFDMLGRLAAAGGIVTACATVAIMILALINKRKLKTDAYVAPSWLEMEIICPACALPQKVPLGESACGRCQLQFSIRIHERRG